MVPFPVPLPERMEIQDGVPLVFQLQPDWVFTEILPLPPLAGKEALVGDKV